jgi:NDP-sugar pyrophosphorylase family protein
VTRIRHAIILAAGRGQRMMPLTEVVPKPMAPYRGSTLIAQGIDRIKARIPNIHVTVGYKKAMLAQHVIEHGASSVFNTEGQTNAWWIYHTLLRYLDEPVYVLTCDNVVELDFDLLERNYAEEGDPACMLVPVRPVQGLEGDYIFHDHHVVTDVDRHRVADIYCSGIQILNPYRVTQLTRDEGETPSSSSTH